MPPPAGPLCGAMSSWAATWPSSTVATGKAGREWGLGALELVEQDSERVGLRRRSSPVEALVMRMCIPRYSVKIYFY